MRIAYRKPALWGAAIILVGLAVAALAAVGLEHNREPTEPARTSSPAWSTYSNTELGFSIRHPSYMVTDQIRGAHSDPDAEFPVQAIFYVPTNDTRNREANPVAITVRDPDGPATSLSSWYEEVAMSRNCELVSISHMDGARCHLYEDALPVYYLYRHPHLFTISVMEVASRSRESQQLYEEMVQSFRLLPDIAS